MSSALVFITGASSGIGQALALRYYRAGFRLALVARRDQEIRAWAAKAGCDLSRCAVYAADVRDPAAITRVGRACLEEHGIPDVVVANAGISVGVDTAIYADLEVIRATFETNNVGMAATFQPFIVPMRARASGRLVGIASVAAARGLPGHGAYCASKAAAVTYLETLRGEMRGTGVRVVTISPGYIDTPLTRRNRYAMPFLMSASDFAERAFVAIRSGRSEVVIPWQMGVVATLMRALPNAVFDRLAANRPRKRRSTE